MMVSWLNINLGYLKKHVVINDLLSNLAEIQIMRGIPYARGTIFVSSLKLTRGHWDICVAEKSRIILNLTTDQLSSILCRCFSNVIYLPYKFYVLGQIRLSKQCRPRSDCFFRSSLIRVYTVCHSISIFWMH